MRSHGLAKSAFDAARVWFCARLFFARSRGSTVRLKTRASGLLNFESRQKYQYARIGRSTTSNLPKLGSECGGFGQARDYELGNVALYRPLAFQ